MMTLSRKISIAKNNLGNIGDEIRYLKHEIFELECAEVYTEAENLKQSLKSLEEKENEWKKELQKLEDKKKKEESS